jgi:hypothetical protein
LHQYDEPVLPLVGAPEACHDSPSTYDHRKRNAARRLEPSKSHEGQALRAADLAVGSDVTGQIIGRSIVQVGGDAVHPDEVRDVAVWRVGYRELGGVRLTEVDIDCHTGVIVRLPGW